jgi:hypothetical protein
MIQRPLTGSVIYTKAMYHTCEDRVITAHLFGDIHHKRTKCSDPDAMNAISLLVSSFSHPHPSIDVFVEVGLGFDFTKKTETNYLNSFIKHFQKEYRCLLKGKENREICKENFPDVRFHNIDFRMTLMFEYNQVVEYWYKHDARKTTLSDAIIAYATKLSIESSIPYPNTGDRFSKDRELLRLSWVYDMIDARKERVGRFYKVSFPYANDTGEFLLDLYYLICKSPSPYDSNSFGVAESHTLHPIHSLYPRYLSRKPYYLFRLAHEYRTIPEVQHDETVQQRFDMMLKDHIDMIRTSSTPDEIVKMGSTIGDKCVQHLSWFMDMYTCFRLLKPYINHSVVVLGVNHIAKINELLNDIGIKATFSPFFVNTENAQCVAVPVNNETSTLTFDHNLFT